ncbi:MAG: CAP domain-containing protein [Eubacterium sp.]|nr:CAP domain-containing protein [Eubacterium sp.]
MNKLSKKVMSLSLVFTLALASAFTSPAVATAKTKTVKVKGKYYQSEARSMLKKINSFRTGKNAWYYKKEGSKKKVKLKNLKKLSYDYALEKVAMTRAAEISKSFSHTRPCGKICFSLYPSSFNWKGENIAAGYTSVSSVMKGWKETKESYKGQGHRRNMLSSDFTCVGIACFEISGYRYWVQEFGSPNSGTKKTTACNSKKTVKVKVKA